MVITWDYLFRTLTMATEILTCAADWLGRPNDAYIVEELILDLFSLVWCLVIILTIVLIKFGKHKTHSELRSAGELCVI